MSQVLDSGHEQHCKVLDGVEAVVTWCDEFAQLMVPGDSFVWESAECRPVVQHLAQVYLGSFEVRAQFAFEIL